MCEEEERGGDGQEERGDLGGGEGEVGEKEGNGEGGEGEGITERV